MPNISEILLTGPGVSYTKGIMREEDGKGTITAWFNEAITDAQSLPNAANSAIFPDFFPGDNSLPKRAVSVKLVGANKALAVAYYAHTQQSARRQNSGAETILQVSPGGFRSLYTEGGATVPADLKQSFAVPVQRISFGSSFYIYDNPPAMENGYMGRTNSNACTIDGYNFPAYSLRFDGQSITHQRYGSTDIFYSRFSFSHSPLYPWNVMGYKYNSGTATYTAVTDPMMETATFPNLVS